jgi:FKBP-type peptidyl-prolyl cis-trans isomerase SlyD
MEIARNRKAKISYILTLAEEGTELTNIPEDDPVEFGFGTNQLLPSFEQNLMGLRAGDQFDFRIEAKDAYGSSDPYAIFDVPKDTFEVDGKTDEQMLKVGNTIPMADNEGNKHMGRIIQVMEDSITMDFNHPLAGKDLRFIGKIIDVMDE